MPHTIIKVATYMCPEGIGNVDSECRFHRRWDNLPDDNQCPHCHLELVKATADDDRQTLTVIGPEHIELEIQERDEPTYRLMQLDNLESHISILKQHESNMRDAQEAEARSDFLAQMEDTITSLKDSDTFFLTSPDEISSYRAARTLDMDAAIIAARVHEDL